MANDAGWEPIASEFLADAELRAAVDALSAHYSGGKTDANASAALATYGVPLWSSEDYADFSDNAGALGWAHSINWNYLHGLQTMTSAWHMASAIYPSLPFWNRGMILAHQPWSGEYLVQPNVWVTAHTTHFTRPGSSWYLPQGNGSDSLGSGGTFVSFVEPENLEHLTIVIEKQLHTGGMERDGPTTTPVLPETVTFVLHGSLREHVRELGLWRTQLSSLSFGGGGSDTLFARAGQLPVINGTVTLRVEVDSVYTLSSVPHVSTELPPATGADGAAASSAFPLPYTDNFEQCIAPSPSRFWSDMSGAFECSATTRDATATMALRQAAPSLPADGAQRCVSPNMRDVLPYTMLGQASWQFVNASVDIQLGGGDTLAFVGVRVSSSAIFERLTAPAGIFLAVNATSWQLASCIRFASAPALASGSLPPPLGAVAGAASRWMRLSLSVSDGGTKGSGLIQAVIDGRTLLPGRGLPVPPRSCEFSQPLSSGYVALGSSWSTNVLFDNVLIEKPSTGSGRCDRTRHPLAAGNPVVVVACGDTGAAARWNVTGADGLPGQISLIAEAAAPPLCMAVKKSPPPPHRDPIEAARFDNVRHGPAIAIRNGASEAFWPASGSCNEVALLSPQAMQRSASGKLSFWVEVGGPVRWADVGFCSPSIKLANYSNGADWVGWQAGQAWIYRNSGLYKTASPQRDQGRKFGRKWDAGDNVTAIQHDPKTLEFLVNGLTQGLIHLDTPLPADAVGCTDVCDGGIFALNPLPPTHSNLGSLEVQKCISGGMEQMFIFDASRQTLTHKQTGGFVSLAANGTDFSQLTLTPKPASGSPLYWAAPTNLLRLNLHDLLWTPGGTKNLCAGVCGDGVSEHEAPGGR